MADFSPAIEVLLKHEGGFAHRDAGKAGCVNRGITQRFILKTKRAPTWEHAYDYVRDMTESTARDIYRTDFWDRYHLNNLFSQQAATILFSMLVNQPPSDAVKSLQRALNELGADLEVDGVLGSITMAAMNATSWESLKPIWHDKVEAHYRNIALFVDDGKHLNGWLRRAAELFR